MGILFFLIWYIASFSHLSFKTRKPETPPIEQVDMNRIINPRDFSLRKKWCYFPRKERQASSPAAQDRASPAGHRWKSGFVFVCFPGPASSPWGGQRNPAAEASLFASFGLLSKLAACHCHIPAISHPQNLPLSVEKPARNWAGPSPARGTIQLVNHKSKKKSQREDELLLHYFSYCIVPIFRPLD